MRLARYLLPLIAVLASPPACFGAEHKVAGYCSRGNSTSVDIGKDKSVATIRGKAGVANLQHDKLEVVQDKVYLNGQSFGPLGKNCEVKFVVTRSSNTLYVDNEPRVRPAPN